MIVATDGPVLAIVALAILAACGSTFFYPAIGAYIPNLVRDERELGPANGLWASLDNLGFIIGPALGGLLVATGGAVFAFLINAATFAFIAAILWRLPPSTEREAGRGGRAGRGGHHRVGRRRLRPTRHRPSREPRLAPLVGILLVAFTLYAFDGGVGILTVILAIDILGAGEAATGYLNAAIGLGGVLGGVVSGVFILRRGLGAPMLAGALVAAAALAILGFVQVLAGALLGLALYSLGYFVVDVILTTILQRILPDAIRGRGIGLEMAVGTVGEMTGAIVLPVIVSHGRDRGPRAGRAAARRRGDRRAGADRPGRDPARDRVRGRAGDDPGTAALRRRVGPAPRGGHSPLPDRPGRGRPGRSSARASPPTASTSSRAAPSALPSATPTESRECCGRSARTPSSASSAC